MKSLDIVNEMVDYWESAVNVACQSNAENGYYDELDIVEYQNRLKKYQQIKQDLEVLEIIRKKNVRIGEIKYYLKEFKEGISISVTKIEDVLIEYNKGVALEDELTLEELLKLKQWLEVNDNGND